MGGGFGGDFTGKTLANRLYGPASGKGKAGGSVGGLSGLPVVRRKAGDQVNQQSMWPKANISLEEFQKFYPSFDPNKVKKVLQDQATRVSNERTRQATERKALTDPLIQSLEKGRGAGSAARKFGALQEGISNMMNNPAGALVGLVSASGPALSAIGKITREDAKFEADLAVKIFGVQKADLTEEHKAALQTIIEDGKIQTTLLELTGKARTAFLDDLVKTATIVEKRGKLQKGKGKLTATVDKRLANLAAGAFGYQAVLNEETGNLQIMDGKNLVSGKDNKKVTGKIIKLLKAYGKNRKLGKDEATAIADSFTEIFPGTPIPPGGGKKVEDKQKPPTKLTPSINSFKYNARKKSQD